MQTGEKTYIAKPKDFSGVRGKNIPQMGGQPNKTAQKSGWTKR